MIGLMRMRHWAFIAVFVGLLAGVTPLLAQSQTPASPADLETDARILRVARTLQLSQAQLDQIKPLLTTAGTVLQQQKASYDDLWQKGQETLQAADRALEAGRQADRNTLNAAEATDRGQKTTAATTDQQMGRLGNEALALLTRTQQALVETPEQRDRRQASLARFEGAPTVAAHIAHYAIVMHDLRPEEYGTMRVAMALRLAEGLVPPRDRLYNQAVADVLRILDAVRQLQDAKLAEQAPTLDQSVANALRLPVAAAATPVSYEDFMFFITSPRSLTALAAFKPAQEVAQ